MEVTSSKAKPHLENGEFIKFGAWTLCLKEQTLKDSNNSKELEPLIFELLILFLTNADKIVTRQELVDQVWKQNFVDDNSINRAMSELRKVLKSPDYDGQYIKTHYKKGYRLLPEVAFTDSNQSQIGNDAAKPSEESVATYPAKEILLATDSTKSTIRNATVKTISLLFIGLSLLVICLWWFLNKDSFVEKGKIKNAVASRTEMTWQRGVYMKPQANESNTILAYMYKTLDQNYMHLELKDLKTMDVKVIRREDMEVFPVSWKGNNHLIFQTLTNTPTQKCEIWLASIDAVSQKVSEKKLMDCQGNNFFSATLNNDLSEIIYTKSNYRNKKGLRALVSRNLASAMEYQITSPKLESGGDFFVKASPNGNKLAFIRSDVSTNIIYISEIDGSEKHAIKHLNYIVASLHWSRDGKRLTWFNSGKWQLITMDLSTKEETITQLDIDYNVDPKYGLDVLNEKSLMIATSYYDSDLGVIDFTENIINEVAFSDYHETLVAPFANGEALYLVNNETNSLWHYTTNGKTHFVDLNMPAVDSMAVSPNEQQLFVQSNRKVYFFDIQSKKLNKEFELESRAYVLSWFDDKNLMVKYDHDKSRHVGKLNIADQSIAPLFQENIKTAKVLSSEKIVVLDNKEKVRVIDIFTGEASKEIKLPDLGHNNWTLLNNKIYFKSGISKISVIDFASDDLTPVELIDFAGPSINYLYSTNNNKRPMLYYSAAGLKENSLINIKLAESSP